MTGRWLGVAIVYHLAVHAGGFPVISKEGRRLAAPSLQASLAPYGVRLDAVHKLGTHGKSALEHSRHPVEAAEESAGGRRLFSVSTQRDLVRLLMKLNAAAYASPDHDKMSWGAEVMKPILEARESLFGPNITTYDEENAAVQQKITNLTESFNAEGNYSTINPDLFVDTDKYESTGVHALEFSSSDLGRILVFRGTYSTGDYANIYPWITEWVLEKNQGMMRYQWLNIAGLNWTDALEEQGKWSVKPSGSVLGVAALWFGKDFSKNMADLATAKGLDPVKAAKTGYWEFTKVIADSAYNSAMAENQTFRITGHSQGGGRAALVSMYLDKKYGKKFQTVTFAAVGGQCWSRDLYGTDGNMLDDVDPYKTHSQVTDYVHPLDIYGHIDYDVGRMCSFKTTDIAVSRAKKYCEKIWGYKATRIHSSGGVPGTEDLALDFSRCKYFTHSWESAIHYLSDDSVLLADGTTDGGCQTQTTIPDGDTRCPHETNLAADGCDDELSCAACSLATDNAGIDCMWCPAEGGQCMSWSRTWFNSCKNGTWTDFDNTKCDAEASGGFAISARVALAASFLSFL